MTLETLARRAAELGAPLEPAQLEAFALYRDELLRWNRAVNLTAIRSPDEVELRHFVDSLSCRPAIDDLLRAEPNLRLIDVGSGGGFPGLPLKIACPDIRITLLDSVGKKTAFLDHLVARLGLDGVRVVTGRAEELAREADHRDAYRVAVVRALAPLPILLELCLPFVRPGGRLVAPRRGDLAAQLEDAAVALRELGGSAREPLPVELGPGLEGFGLVVVEKVSATPESYPRRSGVPARRPLV